MTSIRMLLLVAGAGLLACSNPQVVDLESVREEALGAGAWSEVLHGVSARADATGIQVRNNGPVPIYIFAADRAITPLINWALCTEPPRCSDVQAGTSRHFDSTTVAGWGTSSEITVFWWLLVPAPGGGMTADTVRTLLVRR